MSGWWSAALRLSRRLRGRTVRLVYLSGEPDSPGHVYRVERLAAGARAAGAEASIVRLDACLDHLSSIAAADALMLWRTPWTDETAAAVDAARSAGAVVVFDIDDLLIDPDMARVEIVDFIRSQHMEAQTMVDHFGRLQRAMLQADICTATTAELAGHMRAPARPAHVLPNGFGHETLAASRLAVRRRAGARDGLLRIGYAGGSRTHQHDFAACAPAVAEALRRVPSARLTAFVWSDGMGVIDIAEFPELRGLEDRIEWRDVVPLEDLPGELARFDVNLAPLEVGNPFCEAKSELKYFEAALVGAPTVASPTGPYRRAIRDGETGFLAETPEQWTDKLLALLGDADLRQRIAAAARRDVLRTFGPQRCAREMADFIPLLVRA